MRQADDGAELDREQALVAEAGVKGMIPIGRPFLDYVVSALADAGITRVCLVIGPEHGPVRDHYTRDLAPSRVEIAFAIQQYPRGTADAVAAAESFADGDFFLVLNSDNYYPVETYRALAMSGSAGLVGFEPEALIAGSNIAAERVRKYALVEMDEEGYLVSIVEKPDDATFARLAERTLVSMNLWSFSPAIFEACRRVRPSARGELELQDAVRIAMNALGERFRVVRWAGGVLDLSSRRDVSAVAERLRGVEVRV